MNLLLAALPGAELEKLGEQLQQEYGVTVHCLGLDMLSEDGPERICRWRSDRQFPVNMLVNNIGLGGRSDFERARPHDYRNMLHMNIGVGTCLSHLLIAELKKHNPAYILNVGSTAGFFHIPYKAVYSASKAYVYSFSRALHAELKPLGIHVAVVCPGGADNKLDDVVNGKVNGVVFRSFHHTSAYIAKCAINGLLKKKKIIIPGYLPKIYTYLSRHLPSSWTDEVVKRLFT